MQTPFAHGDKVMKKDATELKITFLLNFLDPSKTNLTDVFIMRASPEMRMGETVRGKLRSCAGL
jgi:hypothetical protein